MDTTERQLTCTGNISNVQYYTYATPGQKEKISKSVKGRETSYYRIIRNRDITIKPADKDGAIAIQDTDKYVSEGLRQLGNKDHYKHTGTNMKESVCTKVNDYIRECKKNGHIPPITADFLITKEP